MYIKHQKKYLVSLYLRICVNIYYDVIFYLLNLIYIIIVIQDELCRTLSNEHGSDVNICLSSIKHIMNLEKPNSIWIIPIHVEIGNFLIVFIVKIE